MEIHLKSQDFNYVFIHEQYVGPVNLDFSQASSIIKNYKKKKKYCLQ